jgi:hypothetical protein
MIFEIYTDDDGHDWDAAISVRLVPAYNSYSNKRQSIFAFKNSIRLDGFNRIDFASSRFPVNTYPFFPLHLCLRKSPILA